MLARGIISGRLLRSCPELFKQSENWPSSFPINKCKLFIFHYDNSSSKVKSTKHEASQSSYYHIQYVLYVKLNDPTIFKYCPLTSN